MREAQFILWGDHHPLIWDISKSINKMQGEASCLNRIDSKTCFSFFTPDTLWTTSRSSLRFRSITTTTQSCQCSGPIWGLELFHFVVLVCAFLNLQFMLLAELLLVLYLLSIFCDYGNLSLRASFCVSLFLYFCQFLGFPILSIAVKSCIYLAFVSLDHCTLDLVIQYCADKEDMKGKWQERVKLLQIEMINK